MNISAVGGNDTILNNTQFEGTMDGGSGNDSISASSGGDSLIGVGGNDTLRGNGGNDVVNGGSGSDILDGGSGEDTADFQDYIVDLNISLDGAANDGAAGEGDNVIAEDILCGSGNDYVTGDASSSIISGGAGSDSLHGGDGNDKLIGGTGSDRVYGDAGIDLILLQDGTLDKYQPDSTDFVSIDQGLDVPL
jgi:Ca2+-binding RTX toxin-like protein